MNLLFTLFFFDAALFCCHQPTEKNGKASPSSEVNCNGSAAANRFPTTSDLLQKITSMGTRTSLPASIINYKTPVRNDITGKQQPVNNQFGNSQQTAGNTSAACSYNRSDLSETHLNRQQQTQQNLTHLFYCTDSHLSDPNMCASTNNASKACSNTSACSNKTSSENLSGNSTKWPSGRIRATSQQIMEAGMYYLGLRDPVKCWYCNGGIQHFVHTHNPCTDTAKCFPYCESVFRKNSPNFIQINVK